LVVKERTTGLGNFLKLGQRVDLNAAIPQTATDSGIEVQEEELGTVTVQQLYKVRCECGRSWFELELPTFVECPACHKLSIVSG
jgi:Zn finger protein HypA/HybF involved in hydrogenase expression